MNISTVDFIVTAKHYAKREGYDGTVRSRIMKWQEWFHKKKGIVVQVKDIDQPRGSVVLARIWQGQWIASCECGGNEFVDPTEPIFFCFSCGNRSNNNSVRPVQFPEDYESIEKAILARPVDDGRGLDVLDQVGLSKPFISVQHGEDVFPLVRSWEPGETLEEILVQNEVIDRWDREKPNPVVIVIEDDPKEPAQDNPDQEVLPVDNETLIDGDIANGLQ